MWSKMAGLSKDGDIFLLPKFKISLYCYNMYFQFLFTVRKILGKMITHTKIKKKKKEVKKSKQHTFQKVGLKAGRTHWKNLNSDFSELFTPQKKSWCSKQAISCVKLDALLVDSC
ncbi:hypothetical protein ACB092_11G022300 [Castanea dentata]